uniref:Retrotransposon protein, putative, unclassified n=1 Tax=Oryza sativa subsp. japonica TaxID=39947 RepID=Q338H6_ORYSJ|nr:retrotransposon protein, putative, unclassified [Oryza sativa Japonica Group]
MSVLNVKALVPVVLDLGAVNYTKWCVLFLITLGKYALNDHILSDTSFPDRASWARMDRVVLTWLYGTIAADLLESVMQPAVTARVVWLCLEQIFLGHHEQRHDLVGALVLAMLQGVNPKYENLRTILPLQRPLPSFIEARSQLILAEINKSSNRSTNSTALLASTGSGNRNGTGGKNPAHATGYSNPNQSQGGSGNSQGGGN